MNFCLRSKFALVSNVLLILFIYSNNVQANSQRGKPIKLTEETWRDLLTGEWMVALYAPWCPACKSLKPEWDRFASWSEDLSIRVAAIDVTENPGLSGRFMVTALPTIYHVKDGLFRVYRGSRNSDAFVSYVEDKKWETSEELSKWKHPDSIQMTLISYFFKISMALRTVHNHLVEDYGVPYWGSYIIFAFGTILLGAALGLVIVCAMDIIFPAKIHDLHLDIDSRKPSISEKEPAGDLPDDDDIKCTEESDLRKRHNVKKDGDEEQDDEDKVKVNEVVDETKKDT